MKKDVCMDDPTEYNCTEKADLPILKQQSSEIFQLSFLFLFPLHCTLSVSCEICFHYSKFISGADAALHSFKESLTKLQDSYLI